MLEANEEFRTVLPIHFVALPSSIWPEIKSGQLDAIDDDVIARRSTDSEATWVVQTYVRLAQIGYPVSIGTHTRPNVINVVPPRSFGRRNRHPDHFILVPQADSHRSMLANFICVQCSAAPLRKNESYVPHWPQAGIKSRLHERRFRISRLGYHGALVNLDERFRSENFRSALKSRGVDFDIDALMRPQAIEHDWGNYADLDAVLAVRNLTISSSFNKPASKLINAWFGEVPALLGPEPAFRHLRQSELDYIEVKTPKEAIEAIDRLIQTPGLYEEMIQNGMVRREKFSVDAIRQRWIDVFEDEVRPDFEEWKKRPRFLKAMKWVYMCAAEPISKLRYKRAIRAGPRILDAS